MITMNRKPAKVPRNIATMTEAEHDAWVKTLSNADHDRLNDRTFRGPVEYFVYWQTDDDSEQEGPTICDSLEQANKEFEGLVTESMAVRIEKVIGHYAVLDRYDLQHRDYTTVREHGKFTDDSR